jgi:hypothetical protein
MKAFPFLTNYVNQTFENEKGRLDYIFLRPILQVSYFFLKAIGSYVPPSLLLGFPKMTPLMRLK